MRRKNIWLKKVLAVSVCAAMAFQPAVTFAEDFSEESVQEATGEVDEETEIGDAAVKEPEVTEEPAEELPEEPAEDTEIPDVVEELPENEDTQVEALEPDTAAEGDMDDEDDPFSDGETPDGEEKQGTCGKGVNWTLKDGILTISGNGEMDDFYVVTDLFTGEITESNVSGWDDYKDEITEVYVEDGVTYIGTEAFMNCSNLKKAVVGNTVKTIQRDAFAGTPSLTDLTLGNSLEMIGEEVFWGSGLTTLVLPPSVTKLYGTSLTGLWNLQAFEMTGKGVYSTSDGVLYKDNGKTLYAFPGGREGEYRIPGNVTSIGESAFSYTNLTKVTIPNTVKKMGSDIFIRAEKLTTLIFEKGIKEIPDSCCFGAAALTKVVIPEGVTRIGDSAFWGCTALKEVTIPSTVTKIGESFESTTKLKFAGGGFQTIEDGTYVSGVKVNVRAQECYTKAFDVLNLVNKERKKRGLKALTMDKSLLETAMMRGFENVLYWDHTRPCGKVCFTANSKMHGENIAAGTTTASAVMNMWMNSEGHKANILGEDYQSIGIGCVCYNGYYYWVQCFSYDGADKATSSSYKDKTNDRKIIVSKDKEYYRASLNVSATSLKKGQTATATVLWDGMPMKNTGVVMKSSNTSVCTVKGGKITAVGAGTATIKMYFAGYENGASTRKITVTDPSVARLTFNPNGGTVTTKTKNVKVKAKAGTLPSPSRKGYTFTGWYTAKNGGTKVTAGTKISKSQTLYTHWTKTTVSKAVISKLTNTAGQKLNVSVNTIKGVRGYQFIYAEKSNFSGYKKVNSSKPSVVLSNLKKNKTYYVKVRGFRKDSAGNYVYGTYSAVKKITVRK